MDYERRRRMPKRLGHFSIERLLVVAVRTHWRVATFHGEHIRPVVSRERGKYLDRIVRQWYHVGGAGLHALVRYRPRLGCQVDFVPFHFRDFRTPLAEQYQQLE